MLSELGDALLDLTVTEKGVGNALYAMDGLPDPGCDLCCSSCHLCCCCWPF